MNNQKKFQTLVTKVNMYLDNELNENAERELLKEIKDNPEYMSFLSKEKSFRDFIKTRLHRRQASPVLIQSIKESIRMKTQALSLSEQQVKR